MKISDMNEKSIFIRQLIVSSRRAGTSDTHATFSDINVMRAEMYELAAEICQRISYGHIGTTEQR